MSIRLISSTLRSSNGKLLKMVGRGGYPLLLTIILFLGCLFFIPTPAIQLREQESLFPLISIMILLAALIQNRAAGLFLAYTVFFTLCLFTQGAWGILIGITLYAVLYFLVVAGSERILKHRVLIYNVLCIFGLLNVLWMVLQYYRIFIFTEVLPQFPDHYPGLFANRNEVSIFLAAVLPFFFRKKWAFCIPVILLGLMLAQTNNGVIAAGVVTIGYLGWKAYRKEISRKLIAGVFLAGLLFISAAFYIHPPNPSLRIKADRKAIELIKARPLGWGMGQSKYVMSLFFDAWRWERMDTEFFYANVIYKEDLKTAYTKEAQRDKETLVPGMVLGSKMLEVHNDYLQWTIDTGIIGGLLLLCMLISHMISFYKTKEKDIFVFLSLIALLLTANVFFTFQLGRFIFMAVLMAAMIQAQYLNEQQSQQGVKDKIHPTKGAKHGR